jgi:hypothetical protein
VHGQKDGQVECNDSELVQMADKEKKKRKCWERSKKKRSVFLTFGVKCFEARLEVHEVSKSAFGEISNRCQLSFV